MFPVSIFFKKIVKQSRFFKSPPLSTHGGFAYLCNMQDYLNELNEQQRAAVTYCDGPQLVIAGAGSGKTRVLTYKIVHLLAKGYEPWRILALTFTNKAAREMRQRIQALVGEKTASRLWMGTFHSIFARILRTHADRLGYNSNFTIYDASDSRSLIKMIIKDRGLDDKIYKPATIASAISWAKNALMSPADYARDRDLTEADKRSKRPRTAELYAEYVQRCRVAGAMDFDDLLFNTNVLLRDNADLCNHYREFFRYVLVDEYQDTNFAQHMIVQRLTQGNWHVTMVGDDAQSIYSFRGANINNILKLRDYYPGLQTFKLEQNYRSTRAIVEVANSLIAKNHGQIPKNVFSKGDEGRRPEVVRSYSDFEEGYLVANRIASIHGVKGDGYNEFAVLYRTNAQSRIIEESLRKRNIPYRIYGGLSFYQRKEIKDAIAYMRLSINPDDDEALRRVINFPTRGIGETTLGKLASEAIRRGTSIWSVILDPTGVALNNGTLKKLDGFKELILGFLHMNQAGEPANEVVKAIIDRTKLISMLITDRTPESISKQENLSELVSAVNQFVTEAFESGEEDTSLAAFLASAALATDQDNDTEGDEERVTLMTVHAAKGLEFGNVFIVGVEEDLFPSAMALQSAAEIEEERRLLYVAITRAKKFCMLTHAGTRYRNGMTTSCRPSRFLSDIDSALLTRVGNAASGPDLRSPGPYAPRSKARTYTPRTSVPSTPPPSSIPTSQTYDITHLHVGDTIKHHTFGVGVINSIDAEHPGGARITVEFQNTGQRTLLLRFARFEKI